MDRYFTQPAEIQTTIYNAKFGSNHKEDQPYEEVNDPLRKLITKNAVFRKTAKDPTEKPAKDLNNKNTETSDPRQDIQHAKNATAKANTDKDITAKDTDAKDSNGSNSYPLVGPRPEEAPRL